MTIDGMTPRSRRPRPGALLVLVALALIPAPGAHGISTRTLFAPTGAAADDELGAAVASAGDVNGDGFDDVIVGAGLNDAGGSGAGRAYVYFGGPGADAVPDVVFTGEAPFDFLGVSVAGPGDVNGDGYDDLLVGAYQNDAGGADAGRAYVYFGGPAMDSVADLTLTGAAAGDQFGFSVAGAGDVDGDGHPDFLVGAWLSDAIGVNSGQAYLYHGGPGLDAVPDLTISGTGGELLGSSVASAGDVNGNGFDDIIVGAPSNDNGGLNAGRAYVYFGGPSADSVPDLVLTGLAAGDEFGVSVAPAGDVDGDGFGDLFVGAFNSDAGGLDSGAAFLFYGGPGADAVPDVIFPGPGVGENFGLSVASAGDVSGDGFPDLIAGPAGSAGAGTAHVYFGGPGIDGVADVVLAGETPGDVYGIAVAGAGDVDGDGFGDVIVGAYENDAGGAGAGRAYVTSFFPYRVLSPNGGEQWVAGRPATVRWLGHDPADVAVSLDGGASWSLRGVGVGGAEDNTVAIVAPGTGSTLAKVRVSYSGQPVSRATSDESDGVFRIVPPVRTPAAAHRLRLTPTGAAAGDGLGVCVAGAGDVNGDGFDDLIVGAFQNDAGGTDAGRTYVYHGGPAADAVADLTLTGEAAGDLFGVSVAGAGDMNGDGYDDVVVGASAHDAGGTSTGRIYVYFGGPAADAVPDVVLSGAGAADFLGVSVAAAGDVNGDGFDDVLAGAPQNDAGGSNAGRVYVLYGGPAPDAVPDLVLTGAAGDNLGYSAAGAGDVNGDGFDDIVAGAFQNDAGGSNAGRAYLFHGGPAADAVPDLVVTGAAAGDFLGFSVAGAGDVNGDGHADFLVGAAQNDAGGTDAGRAYLFHGGPAADAEPDLVFTGAAAGEFFARWVAPAGDVNGDGFDDLVVGAPGSDAQGTDAGRAYVFHGGPAADTVADLVLTGAAAGDNFGISAAGAGDVNGDGFDDLAAGATGHDAGGANAGRAYLYHCNRYFVLSPGDDVVWNVGAAQTVSWTGAEPADLWLSVDAGRTYALLRHDVGGNASNTVGLLVPHVPTSFARVRVTPADPALRGAGESDSLFTIRSSVALLNLTASLGDDGVELRWSTDPQVGPLGLTGYRLYRLEPGDPGTGTRIGPDPIAETGYVDPAGASGTTYRLTAVNGLREELELGRVSLAPAAALAAWPLPYRGGDLRVSFGVSGFFGSGSGDAVVELFDVAGRRVKTLAQGRFETGYRTLTWDGRDERGAPVADGVYFLRAVSAGVAQRLKISVLR